MVAYRQHAGRAVTVHAVQLERHEVQPFLSAGQHLCVLYLYRSSAGIDLLYCPQGQSWRNGVVAAPRHRAGVDGVAVHGLLPC